MRSLDFSPENGWSLVQTTTEKWITGRRIRSGCTVHRLLTHSVAMIVPTSASIASMAKKIGTTPGSKKKKLSSAQIMSR
jgi:hypothetical protein